MDKYKTVGIILLLICVASIAHAYTTLNKAGISRDYVQKATKEMEDGNYNKAIQLLKEAIKVDKKNAVAYYNLGIAYGNEEMFHRYFKLPGQTFTEAGHPEMQKNYENAVFYLQYVEKNFPEYKAIAEQALGDVNFLYYCGYVNREKYVMPHYEYALVHKEEVEKFLGREGVSALYSNLARTYLAMAEVEKAEEYYEKAIEVYSDPGIDTAYEHLAWVELELGKVNEAYEVAKQFVERASKYEWDSDLGLAPACITSYLLGKYDEAEKYANEIITNFPESAYLGEAYRILAMIYYEKGNKDKAIEMLEKDILSCTEAMKDPEDAVTLPTSRYERALAYYLLYRYTKNTKNLENAISDFEWIIENKEKTQREVAHRNYYLLSHLSLSSIYSQQSDFSKAKSYLEKLKNELSTEPNMKGWNKFIDEKVDAMLNNVSNNQKIDMPRIVWILSQ